MADLLATNVQVIATGRFSGTASKNRLWKRVSYNNTTAGTVANKLLASAFGFKYIEHCSHVFYDAGTKAIYPAAPVADGTYIGLTNPNQATDANRTDLFDLATGATKAYLYIVGYD